MLRKFSWVLGLALLVPTAAQAQFHQGDWELTLSGQAANSVDFDGVTIAAAGSLGYFLTKEIEVSLRQSVGYTDVNVSSAWNGNTSLAADYHFDLGQWQPFLGGSFGYIYGEGANSDTWEAAPEGGVKYFVNSTTFIQLLVQYQFFFNDNGNDFEDGQFVYSLGIGFRW